ncbi:MAG: hypothetical protein ABF633_03380 [Clostridium sp.]|uniref:deoxynucleotide monophosphate kinase family protein n=1 Tax=Clostridium sp. TaxID=1506 RepID=UPI0039EBBFF0
MKIAIVGKMRSGKDTVGSMIENYGDFHKMALADGITGIIKDYFPEALLEGKPRKHYQQIGSAMRELDKDVWVNYLDRRIKDIEALYRYEADFLVTDCRFVNEADYLRKNGFLIIKVVATDEIRVQRLMQSAETTTLEQMNHKTEAQIDLITPDYYIYNNGTLEELEKKVDEAMQYYEYHFVPTQKYYRELEGYNNAD